MSPYAQAQLPYVVEVFARRFPSSRRGAREARLLAVQQLAAWDVPEDSELCANTALIVAELVANAVTHGHVRDRDFGLVLTRTEKALHVEVSDTRTDASPPGPETLATPVPGAESGRGLVLVDALAARWGVEARTPAPGKRVWAELDLAD